MMMSCSLRVEVHALWVQRSKLLYPVALPSSSQAFAKTSHDFKDCDLRSSREWTGLLKWPATGFSVRLCVMSFRCTLKQSGGGSVFLQCTAFGTSCSRSSRSHSLSCR